jgi:hypothetical protein
MAASLITRLPADKRTAALQRLSRNANAPGASLRQTNGRAQARLAKRAGEMGIFLIESNVTAALAASVGGVNPPGVPTVTIDTNAGTPATTDITTSELDPVTWAGAGQKALAVTVPAGLLGQALVTV